MTMWKGFRKTFWKTLCIATYHVRTLWAPPPPPSEFYDEQQDSRDVCMRLAYQMKPTYFQTARVGLKTFEKS
jgi:hypothetical protein